MSTYLHRTVSANDIQMHVVEQGQGPLVLMCHGFPETWYSWRHQIDALAAAGYRVVAPDLRGYGSTERPANADQYTIMHSVGDMVALLDQLGAEQATIIGNDWGATLAWHAALTRPDRFPAVVALGVPMMAQPPRPPTQMFPQTKDALFYTLYFQLPGVAEIELGRDVSMTLRKILFAASADAGPRREGDGTPNPFGMVSREVGLLGPLPDPPILPGWLSETDLAENVRAFEQGGFGGGLNFYRNLDRNRELLAAYAGARISTPALFLVGERDPGLLMPGMQSIIDGMRDLVPLLGETVTIPSAGHWLQQEKPAEVTAEILRFLEK